METVEDKRFVYEFGKFTLDPQEKTLFAGDVRLHLPAKEFETLVLLVENDGKALTKNEMMAAIWQDAFVEEANLAKQISRLRKIFNTDGRQLIETLPKHGYRFSAGVRRTIPVVEEPVIVEKRTLKRLTVKVENEFDDAPHALPPKLKNKFLTVPYLAAVSAFILLGATAVLFWNQTAKPVNAKISSIAVLPLKPLSGEEENKALGLGLTDALITKLGTLRQIVVRPTSAVAPFAEANRNALEIGEKLKTDAVLEGTIQQSEGRIRINARLLKTANGEQLWAEKFDAPNADIFALQDALSNRIAQTLAFELTGEQSKQFARHATENAEAYEKYLRGRFYQSQNTAPGFAKSLELYEQAIALDANFADAHAGLADVYLLLYNFGVRPAEETVPKAKQSLNRALQSNPNLSDAYTALALSQFLYDLDWQAAEKSLQKAIEINPSNANAFLRYGYFLTLAGKFDEALQKLEKARELNPLSPLVQTNIGLVFYCQHQYPPAIENFERIAAENPEFPLPVWLLGTLYGITGDEEKSLDYFIKAIRLEGDVNLADRIAAARQKGNQRAAVAVWLADMKKQNGQFFYRSSDIAGVHALLRERGETLDWLEKAAAEHDGQFVGIIADPKYDFIRDEARFQTMLQKINFK